MLFDLTLKREILRTFGATLVVLITVVMTMMLIRVLLLANRGLVNPTDILLTMGYFALGQFATLLTLCLFIAIVTTLSRMHSDSEMVIWFASGRGLSSLLKPIFSLALPIFLTVALLALFVWPWTNEQMQNMRTQFEQRSDLDRITPGAFQESANGNRVFFIDKPSAGTKGNNNIYIFEKSINKEAVTTARSGHIENQDGNQLLLLDSGERSEIDLLDNQTKVVEFEEYGSLIHKAKISPLNALPIKVLSSWSLVQNPNDANLGELSWRIGLVFAAFNFVIFGVLIPSNKPRVSRGISIFTALFTFIVYFNLINYGQSWIASGGIAFASWLFLLHGSAFLLGASLLFKKHNNWTIFSTFKN
jgi:lipopolysaccharide export system permease protein